MSGSTANLQGNASPKQTYCWEGAYGFSAQSILNLNLNANVPGLNGASLRASWLRRFW